MFCKKVKKIFVLLKATELEYLVQGGELYCAFPFSKGSLFQQSNLVGVDGDDARENCPVVNVWKLF
jgi:hypothetical protein